MVLMERDRINQRLGKYKQSVAQVRNFRRRFKAEELAEFCFITPIKAG